MKAKTVNDEIFEMHKKNELNRIKKLIYMKKTNKSNKSGLGRKGKRCITLHWA